MSEFIVRLRRGGWFVLEGDHLHWAYKDGSDLPLITILDEGNHRLAIMPADAVEAVYRKDAEKEAKGAD